MLRYPEHRIVYSSLTAIAVATMLAITIVLVHDVIVGDYASAFLLVIALVISFYAAFLGLKSI
jgi:pyruvate/2-oxoglutarate dehydrogenase complex dihydrolipoamide acyltransferase (E2) component